MHDISYLRGPLDIQIFVVFSHDTKQRFSIFKIVLQNHSILKFSMWFSVIVVIFVNFSCWNCCNHFNFSLKYMKIFLFIFFLATGQHNNYLKFSCIFINLSVSNFRIWRNLMTAWSSYIDNIHKINLNILMEAFVVPSFFYVSYYRTWKRYLPLICIMTICN